MESIFDCGICYRPYNHTEKKPLSLPCGHTFCQECLITISKHSRINCPLDKIAHKVGIENLPVNYPILSALPNLTAKPEGEKTDKTKNGEVLED
jgi:hypothetical protein